MTTMKINPDALIGFTASNTGPPPYLLSYAETLSRGQLSQLIFELSQIRDRKHGVSDSREIYTGGGIHAAPVPCDVLIQEGLSVCAGDDLYVDKDGKATNEKGTYLGRCVSISDDGTTARIPIAGASIKW